jgi:hypothetical protein
MGFHEVPWNSMRFYDVLVNRSVPTEANRGLTSYKELAAKYSHLRRRLLQLLPTLKSHLEVMPAPSLTPTEAG